MRKPHALLSAALALCLTLAGCGAGAPEADPRESFVGTWEVDSAASGGDEYSSEEIDDALEMLGASIYLELDDNGDATFEAYGQELAGTWELDGDDAITITINNEDAEATLDGDELTLVQGEVSMTFVQIDPDDKVEYAAPAETEDFEEYADPSMGAGVIVDDEYFTVEVVEGYSDFEGDPGFNLRVTNNSHQMLSLSYATGTWRVNGVAEDPVLWIDVEPGATVEQFVWWHREDVGPLEDFESASGDLDVTDSGYEILRTYEDVSFM